MGHKRANEMNVIVRVYWIQLTFTCSKDRYPYGLHHPGLAAYDKCGELILFWKAYVGFHNYLAESYLLSSITFSCSLIFSLTLTPNLILALTVTLKHLPVCHLFILEIGIALAPLQFSMKSTSNSRPRLIRQTRENEHRVNSSLLRGRTSLNR